MGETKEARATRLGAALRENLKRRKARDREVQARGSAAERPEAPEGSTHEQTAQSAERHEQTAQGVERHEKAARGAEG